MKKSTIEILRCFLIPLALIAGLLMVLPRVIEILYEKIRATITKSKTPTS